MNVVTDPVELRERLHHARSDSAARIGFVPTMGALHQGHLSLVRLARSSCSVVVVSIFVNPLQFGPSEDLERYPRDQEGDVRALAAEGTDIVFVPRAERMFEDGYATRVQVGELATLLEGQVRPGHFDGVATVVAKLFNLVEPDVAVFGQKDAQQLAVIRRLVHDLSFDVEIVAGPTVREPDGLAMSSRNVYLSPEDRRTATVLYRALQAGRDAARDGADPPSIESAMRASLAAEPAVAVDYTAVVDPLTFGAVRHGRPALLLVAARLGSTRLIDNLFVEEVTGAARG